MRRVIVYVHGQGGSPSEAEHYRPLFPADRVIGFDYAARSPWEAKDEFTPFFEALREQYDSVCVVANSIGAYFAMSALSERQVDAAWFISPIVDMERLICDMMSWAAVTEAELRERGEIETAFGQTLSWEYLTYVRCHPIRWRVPTRILYGGRDDLTSRETVTAFAARSGAELTVMEDGAHWFHTEEQMEFLDRWIAAR